MKINSNRQNFSRRSFLGALGVMSVSPSLAAVGLSANQDNIQIIDIHQHTHYLKRSADQLLAHQKAMGVSMTILHPAGRDAFGASTHKGQANGLQAEATGNLDCYEFAKQHSGSYRFAANEVPDIPEAVEEVTKYLKLGAVAIGEVKFGLEADSKAMQRFYQLAEEFDVPILLHWQHQMYTYGYDRFHKMLEKFPKVRFIGHAQSWWANIDKNHKDQSILYPKTKVTAGGLTDRLLSDYPNIFGDLSAGSGLNSLTRDEQAAREFLIKHQDKLLYGSDCADHVSTPQKCQGVQTIAEINKLVDSRIIREKIFNKNAKKIFKL